ncbi:hypothetical protein NMY22_g12425 [Coprinellus aureogranulatus]|nr:hypothetical protein NMY22_g12425 [Coprinellus aureogranulatus]
MEQPSLPSPKSHIYTSKRGGRDYGRRQKLLRVDIKPGSTSTRGVLKRPYKRKSGRSTIDLDSHCTPASSYSVLPVNLVHTFESGLPSTCEDDLHPMARTSSPSPSPPLSTPPLSPSSHSASLGTPQSTPPTSPQRNHSPLQPHDDAGSPFLEDSPQCTMAMEPPSGGTQSVNSPVLNNLESRTDVGNINETLGSSTFITAARVTSGRVISHVDCQLPEESVLPLFPKPDDTSPTVGGDHVSCIERGLGSNLAPVAHSSQTSSPSSVSMPPKSCDGLETTEAPASSLATLSTTPAGLCKQPAHPRQINEQAEASRSSSSRPAGSSLSSKYGSQIEQMAQTLAKIEAAKYRLGHTVADALELVQQIVNLQGERLELLSKQTPESLESVQHFVDLQRAIRSACLSQNIPFFDPSGAKVEDVKLVGERFAQSPAFLEPLIEDLWSVLGSPSLAKL